MLLGSIVSPRIATAQPCNACLSVSIDTMNAGMVNVVASCSNASANALYDYYVDGILYATFPLPYFQIPFTQAGTYNFQVVVNDQGCIDSASQTLTINPNCDANFYVYQFGGGLHYFTPNGLISQTANFSWDYGDGNTGSGSTAYHTYTAAGNYTVCLVISDTAAGGCMDTACQSITVSNLSASCFPNFYYNVDPFTGSLYADAFLSTYDPLNYSMTWYLNNVLVQQSTSTSYSTTLTTPGNYDLKLVLGDNTNQPCDSLVQTIYWNGPIITNPTCLPCFTFTYNATMDSVLLDASCSILPSGGSLQWTINGNSFSDPGTPFWQGFANSGIQVLTLLSIDSNNNYCDSTFQYVYIYPPACTSCLSVTPVSGSTSDYVFDGSCTNNAISYSWFVDNNYVVSTANPQFTYSFNQSGTYTVCLQTQDASGNYCNQACTTVVVNTPTSTLFDLSGRIYKVDNSFMYSPTASNEAKVYLIKLITGGTLEAIDSTTTDAQGYYSFSNKPIDDYRIKVALNASSPDYNTNIPTYYATALMWYDAQIVTLFGNTYNRDIYMLYGTNPGGNGFISGNVFQGANKPTRGVTDITLILMDQATQQPVAYAKPNANGDYSFGNVPNGTYKVYGELLNRASIPDNIVISSMQSTYTNKNFVYNDNVIQPTNTAVSIPTITEVSSLRISPNPATTSIRLLNEIYGSTIVIRDLTGRILQQLNLTQGEATTIQCDSWQKGIYLIEEISKGIKTTHKLNVQ